MCYDYDVMVVVVDIIIIIMLRVEMVVVKLLRFSEVWGSGGDEVSNNNNNNNKSHTVKVAMIVIIEWRTEIVKQYHKYIIVCKIYMKSWKVFFMNKFKRLIVYSVFNLLKLL
jgi:hypothetical protein